MPRLGRLLGGALFFGIAQVAGAQSRTAVLTGTVIVDSVRTPIEGAEVLLPKLSKQTRSARDGRFRMGEIPAGIHEVIVRHVGFVADTLEIAFAADGTVDREFLLRRVPTLESVTVEASNVIPSFEEHRKVGMGTFITRAELEQKEMLKLGDIFRQVRGARVHRGSGGRAFLYSGRRQVTSIDPTATKGNPSEFNRENAGMGAPFGLCYAQVYMDDRIVYRGEPAEPVFDVNTIAPEQIEAIEYYSGPGSTPMRYSRLNSQCGVIVIHTRRTPGKVQP